MKIMITGAAGFIGGFLGEHCARGGASALGIDLDRPKRAWPGDFAVCDIRDARRLREIVLGFQPERIFHLAAQSYPTVSLERPNETFEINAGGTINVFEAARELAPKPWIVVACSSAEYGPVEAKDLPVREDYPLRPVHPYGVSKVAQDLLAYQYFANYGIPTARIRIFNTTGPGKENDVCSDLARRAVEIELGVRAPELPVGNLHTRRAIADVRDLVRALWITPDRCVAGEAYNVGGKAIYSIEEILAIVRTHVRVPLTVVQDPHLVRRCDEPVIAGNITKFRERTEWRAEIGLAQTVADMVAWWRERLAGRATAVLRTAPTGRWP